MKYFAVALLTVFASSTASAAGSWKTFFAQTNLAPASNSVFHAEKNLGIYVELESNSNKLPKFLAEITFPLPHSAQSEVYNYLAQAEQVSLPRFAVVSSIVTGAEQTQSEIQLVHRFVNEFSSTSGPAFMVWKLGKDADLEKVSQALQEIAQKNGVAVAATYPVPATKAEEIALKRRRLAETAPVAGFSGPEYVLMCWVLITLVIIAFFVFCCIPWAPELDAGLRSSLKSKAD